MFTRKIIDILGNAKKSLLGTCYWSMISSLLHLVGLRPRVYYTLTNFRGGGAKAPPQYANVYCLCSFLPATKEKWFVLKVRIGVDGRKCSHFLANITNSSN